MSRRRRLGVAAAVLAALVVVGVLATALGGHGARSSVLSRGAEGWAGMRRYLEARGVEVAVLDRPLSESVPGRGTLVLAFPWQRLDLDRSLAGDVGRHLNGGGDLLVAYSGGAASAAEELELRQLELDTEPARPEAPLSPMAWRRHVTEVWRLNADDSFGGSTRPLVIPALDRIPAAGDGARVLYRSPRGRPVVFTIPRGHGRIVVVPASALANARLALPGNTDLLESLARSLPGPWSFDESHHGLVAAATRETSERQSRVLDLVLIQLLALYALVAITLGRRFGPPWREPPVVTGSTGAFFLGLGALHHRLGHHAEAARLLVARSRELDRNLSLPTDLERRAAGGVDASGLLEIARDIANRRPSP